MVDDAVFSIPLSSHPAEMIRRVAAWFAGLGFIAQARE